MTETADFDRCKYSVYCIAFNASGSFLYKIVARLKIFGAYMSSLMHIDNKKKDVLILGKSPTYGFDDIKLILLSNWDWADYN